MILQPPYAPGLAMIMIPIVLTSGSLYGCGFGVRAGWTICEETGAHLYHHFICISHHQLSTGYCGRIHAHARRRLALFHHLDDHACGGRGDHSPDVDEINRR